jgi:ribosomal protein L7Ae-like RNA K-turn-binding protein
MKAWKGRWKMIDRLLSLLGLCRKAGLCSFGHDAAKTALRQRRAKLCLLCGDASPRLKEEFRVLAGHAKTPLIETAAVSSEIKRATQHKAAVLTVDNAGFADSIQALFRDP